MKLESWTSEECLEYTKLIYKKNISQESYKNLKLFEEKIINEYNDNFYSRPLFLNMMIDLEVTNETEMSDTLKIEENLSKNLSELYYKYILLHIQHELTRINYVGIDNRYDLSKHIFNDLKNFAVNKFLKLDEEQYSEHFKTILDDKKHTLAILKYNKKLYERNNYYEKYEFSHKSFYEYLIGYALAESVLEKFPDLSKVHESTCTEVWKIFQNYEISDHFTQDVKRRIQKNKNIDKKQDYQKLCNNFFKIAFMKVLEDNNFHKYEHADFSDEEMVEQALSYIGRFKIELTKGESQKIKSRIFDNNNSKKENCNFVFYRTACLTFANIENTKYIFNFVENLSRHKDYLLQDQQIQKNYYGTKSTIMREKLLKSYIQPFLDGKSIRSNFCHALFTFFTIDLFIDDDIEVIKKYNIENHIVLFEKIMIMAKAKSNNEVIQTCHIINNMANKIYIKSNI
jgi:hypothetical protein